MRAATGDRQAERLGGLEVDHQLKLGGLLDRQVTGLGALEDLVDVPSGVTRELPEVGAVGDQSPSFNERPRLIYPGKPMLQGKCSDTRPLGIVSSAPEYDHRIGPVTFRLHKGLFNLVGTRGVDGLNGHARSLGSSLHVGEHHQVNPGGVTVHQCKDARRPRNSRSNKFDVLRRQFWKHHGQSRDVAARTREAAHETSGHGVPTGTHNNRDRARSLLRRQYARRRPGDDYVNLETYDFADEIGETFWAPGGPNLGNQILSFHVTELQHLGGEGGHDCGISSSGD